MTAADMERRDVPLAVVEASAVTLAGLTAEQRHLCDPDDTRFAHLPCPHPETCSTSADYPGFDAWITQQQNLNTRRGNR